MAKWLLKGPNGERAQIITRGEKTPTDDGSNPDAWEEIKVNSHSDDIEHEVFDEDTRRWKVDPEKKAKRDERDRKAASRAALGGDALLDRFVDLERRVAEMSASLATLLPK